MLIEDWKRHIDQVVADVGEWVGLADANGVPLCDLPPAESVSAPETRLAVDNREVVIPARGRIAPTNSAVEALVAKHLGQFDETGALAPATDGDYMVIVARPGLRLAFNVVFARAEGPSDAPNKLTIGGVSLDDLLEAHPAPSVPLAWHTSKLEKWTEDAGGKYAKPRQLGAVEMATKADGYTLTGPAVEVIRELCQDSFDAVNAMYGFKDPHLVVDYGTPTAKGERITIQVQDDALWPTMLAAAESAGVNVHVELWWPGDAAFPVRGQRIPNADLNQDEKFGPPVLKSFTHPIGRVVVEEVGK